MIHNLSAIALCGILAALVACVVASGCAHLPSALPGPGSSSSPLPSPTPTGSATPSSCSTQDPTATLIYMSANAAPTIDPTYGPLFGYTDSLDNNNNPTPTHILGVTRGTDVQFVNFDFSVNHAAVALPGPTFPPPVPNPFPTNANQQIGTSITATGWSTGLVPPYVFTSCFSQGFSAPTAGTFLFGEPATYQATNTRDVLIVQ